MPTAQGAKKPATTTRRRTTTVKKPATTKAAPKTIEPTEIEIPAPKVERTLEQQEALLTTYHALKTAGLEIPADIKAEVETMIANLERRRAEQEAAAQEAAATKAQQIAEANKNGPWFVRNCANTPFNLRLDRHTERRRLELKPRGLPGDMHPLLDDDLKDPALKTNLNLGVIEVIPAGEANAIIEKQTTNMGHRVHTPLAVLRNELGQPYAEGQVKVAAEFNSQGVTVAAIDQRVTQGHVHDREVGWGGLQRTGNPAIVQNGPPTVHSAFVPTGGNPAAVQHGPLGDNARAQIADDLARRKDVQGPAAGLGGQVRVTVDPVVRT